MKTVHGADFYASKKHKGSHEDGSGGTNGRMDGSPRSDDGTKTVSLSSPSVKSESDVHSPQAQDSPIGGQDMDTLVRILTNPDNPEYTFGVPGVNKFLSQLTICAKFF